MPKRVAEIDDEGAELTKALVEADLQERSQLLSKIRKQIKRLCGSSFLGQYESSILKKEVDLSQILIPELQKLLQALNSGDSPVTRERAEGLVMEIMELAKKREREAREIKGQAFERLPLEPSALGQETTQVPQAAFFSDPLTNKRRVAGFGLAQLPTSASFQEPQVRK